MHKDLTNLLPSERRHALTRNYFLRLGVVIVFLVTVLTCMAALLLLPTYVFLAESERSKEARLASIEVVLSSASETAFSTRLLALSKNIQTLSALAQASSSSVIIRSVLVVPRAGITLSNFMYTPALGTQKGTLAISGVATTRGALRDYQLALQNTPFVLSADLPVSSYAKNDDATFTITMTLKP